MQIAADSRCLDGGRGRRREERLTDCLHAQTNVSYDSWSVGQGILDMVVGNFIILQHVKG